MLSDWFAGQEQASKIAVVPAKRPAGAARRERERGPMPPRTVCEMGSGSVAP